MVITRIINTPITRTHKGDASNAMSKRKAIREMEDTITQPVGMRNDKEKEMYESYMSRERYYERLYQLMRRLGSGVYLR